MSFDDVHDFVQQHQACGSLTPSTSTSRLGGYLLTLACGCGATFDRWVAPDEAKDAPFAPPSSTAAPVTAAPGSATASPPSSRAAPAPPAPEVSALGPAGALQAAMRDALASVEATPFGGAESPQNVEAAMKAALDAVHAAPPVDAVAAPPPPAASPAPTRVVPDRQALRDVLRTTIEAVHAEDRRTAAAKPGSRRMPPPDAPLRTTRSSADAARVTPEPARARSTGALITGILVLTLVVAGVVAWQFARSRSQHEAPAVAARTVARPDLAPADRATAGKVVAVLRDVQSVSRTDVPYAVYFNRVSLAQRDVEPQLASVTDPELRGSLGTALALYQLAATAWTAKTLNEREKWEAVGDDPNAEVCPAAKRVLGVADEPPGMSRSSWRGMAIAASIPLLWDCASERIVAVDGILSGR